LYATTAKHGDLEFTDEFPVHRDSEKEIPGKEKSIAASQVPFSVSGNYHVRRTSTTDQSDEFRAKTGNVMILSACIHRHGGSCGTFHWMMVRWITRSSSIT